MSEGRGTDVEAVADLATVAWRNGLGTTRPIASASGDDRPDWRISVATVTDGAAFSPFPGYTRAFTELPPGRITLVRDGLDLVPDGNGTVWFDGDAGVAARVVGGPAQAVNVMCLPGRHAHLQWRTVTGDVCVDDPTLAAVLLVDGVVTDSSGTTVAAPAVIRPPTPIHCTRARLLEVRLLPGPARTRSRQDLST